MTTQLERKILALVKHSFDAITLIDPLGKILYASSSIKQIAGFTSAEMVGMNAFKLVHPRDLPLVMKNMAMILKKKRAVAKVEIEAKRKDGSWMWIEVVGTNLLSDPDIQAIVINFRDITQQKKSQRRLLYLSSLVESNLDAIWSLSLENTIKSWNEGAERLYGYKVEDIIGKPTDLIVAPNKQRELQELTKKIIKGQMIQNFETGHITKDGKRIDVSVSMSPIKDVRGDVVAVSVIARDITEHKKALDSLQNTLKELANIKFALDQSSIVAITDKSGVIQYVNDQFLKISKYSKEELIGKTHRVINSKYHPKEFFRTFWKTILSGKVWHGEIRNRAKDGTYYWVDTTVIPLLGKDGKPKQFIAIRNDITQKKELEQNLKFLSDASTILSASIDYETTLKNLGNLIIPYLADYCRIVVTDKNKQIKEIAVNHIDHRKIFLVKELYNKYKDDTANTYGVGKILKTGKAEHISKITPDIFNRVNPQIARIMRKLNLQSYMGVPMKIGKKIVGALTFSSTTKERLYTSQDLEVAKELAQRAALAIDNARLYMQSQKAVMIRDDFISVASHELKTPVTSLKMYTQAIQRKLEKRKKSDFTKPFIKMNEQINKLTVLISDLLNVSKIQHGKLELEMEAVDLNELSSDTVELLQETERKHTIIVVGKISRKVYADSYRIYQVLTNLLTNALKYSPLGDKVIVRLSSKKDYAKVSIQDFGIGIEKEYTKKIFDRFYRVTSPEGKTYPGLGMGLYIANEIVKRHGGAISVVSSKGKGSTFSFTLPYSHNNRDPMLLYQPRLG